MKKDFFIGKIYCFYGELGVLFTGGGLKYGFVARQVDGIYDEGE